MRLLNEYMRMLGVDYGERNLGLAISVAELARPLGVVKRDRDGKYWRELVSMVRENQVDKIVVRENQVDKIVVGLPEGEGSKRVRKFGDKLGELAGAVVDYQDETLSTKDAQRKAIEAGKSQKVRRKNEHAFAAAVILQEYMDNM
jgi:putative Holliday junction resolvase